MRHHLSFSFLDPHEIKRMEDQAKNAKLLPPTNGWQHLKTSEEKVLAYTFSPEFLGHPQLDWWSANYDVSYLVATGARLGCLVCKAAAYHRLSFFAMHEDEDDETDRDASKKREEHLEGIKKHLFLDSQPPFLCLLTAVELGRKDWISDECIRKWIHRAIAAKDYRIVRFAPDFPELFASVEIKEDHPDWLYWQAWQKESIEGFKKASSKGSLEATMELARECSLSVEERTSYYKYAAEELKFPMVLTELAICQLEWGQEGELQGTLKDLTQRGDKRAFAKVAARATDVETRKKFRQEAGEYSRLINNRTSDSWMLNRLLGNYSKKGPALKPE